MREEWGNRGHSVTGSWGQKHLRDAVLNFDLLFGVTLSQFQAYGQSVHFWVLVSHGRKVVGLYPSEVAMFGLLL